MGMCTLLPGGVGTINESKLKRDYYDQTRTNCPLCSYGCDFLGVSTGPSNKYLRKLNLPVLRILMCQTDQDPSVQKSALLQDLLPVTNNKPSA
jgi:hypothetical protein